MNVLVEVKGRPAIPVRAIPFLTGWNFLPPAELSHVLAGDGGSNVGVFGNPNKAGVLRSYVLDNEKVIEFARSEWRAAIVPHLQALSAQIGQDQPDDRIRKWQWRLESIKVLPPGVFVWKDDFEELHAWHWYQQFSMTYCALRDWNGEKENDEADHDAPTLMKRAEQLNDLGEFNGLKRDLMEHLRNLYTWKDPNYSPYLGQIGHGTVMDGFNWVAARVRASEADEAGKVVAPLYEQLEKLDEQILYWEGRSDLTANDAEIKANRLKPLTDERADLRRRLNEIRDADADAHDSVNAEARASKKQAKVWTDEKKAEVRAYREVHGLRATAKHFHVSETLISRHVPPEKKSNPKGGTWGAALLKK